MFLLTLCSLEMYMKASNIPRSQHGPGKIDKGGIHVYGYNLQRDNVTCHGKKYRWGGGVYMSMATPYRQIMSPAMVKYTREGHTCDGYTLQADNVTCHGKIYKGGGVYMSIATPYRQIMPPVMVRYTRGYTPYRQTSDV